MTTAGRRGDGAAQRRRAALEAATAVARKLGIRCSDPAIVADANNTIVHLAPAPVVAKVAVGALRPRPEDVLGRELDVGLYLAARDAPIAPPTRSVPPGPHRHEGQVLTLWELREHDPGAQVDASALSAALRAFHEAFVGYPRRLPSFTDQIEDAGRVLSDDALAPALARDDRELLRAAQRRLLGSLRGAALSERPLHGDPHPDGNVLLTPQGPLLVDFEAACMGPVEWDLTSTGTEVARTYPGADPALVDILGVARSLCVATWCWMQPERDPAVAEAARWHLTRIRQAVG